MARGKADKEYRSFIKGLITEATGLTYPEGSCRELDNVDLGTDGSARRRLGISQENDGGVIGAGLLSDTLFTNDTGGPLSLAPSIIGSSVAKTYDGTDLDGEWILAGEAYDVGVGQWQLYAQRGSAPSMFQDANVSDYNRINISFQYEEDSSNEGNLALLIGSTLAGAGQGIFLENNSVHTITTSGSHSGYVVGPVLGDFNNTGSRCHVTVNLTRPVGGLSFVGTLTVRRFSSSGPVAVNAPLNIGVNDDYFTIAASSGQRHASRHNISQLRYTLEVFGVNSDLPDVGVADEGFAVTSHSWVAPNGDGTKSFEVFQIGNTLLFRDTQQDTISNISDTSVPVQSQQLQFDGIGTGFIYNMSSSQAAAVKLQSATGFGRIWFTSRAVVPFYAELAEDGTSIRLRAVGTRDGSAGVDAVVGQRLIRDIAGVEDGMDPDETQLIATPEHMYNLLNQGWPSDKINTYLSATSSYPSNNQQWWLGKDGSDTFTPSLLIQQDFGSRIPVRGRYLIDALLGERDGRAHAITGATSPIDFSDSHDATASSGWEAVAFYTGRVWFAGDVNPKRPGGVYFSRTLESVDDSGKFYQQNDPTSEHFNQLLATDGGYIALPEAGSIRRLVPFGAGILVVAEAGVWFVYGRSGGFKANDYAVEKITSTGTVSPGTVIPTDQQVLFWADNSVHRISLPEDQRAYLPVVEDIGEETIFKYYQLIPRTSRSYASSVYDPISKKAFWFWLSDEDKEKAASFQSLYNRALIFDTRTQAFSAYSFECGYSDPLYGVTCAFPRRTPSTPAIYEPVYDSTFEAVVDSLNAAVYGPDGQTQLNSAELGVSLKLVIVSSVEQGLRIGEFGSLSFTDFDGLSGVTGTEATAYLVTGDETLGDLQRNKQTTYVHSFFTRTETGFYPDQTPKRASGCTLRARWDWTNGSNANRWSESQNAYRYRKAFAPAAFTDAFNTGEEILYTKLKVRGKGRAVSFWYQSVAGKDFRLLGFAVPYTASSD